MSDHATPTHLTGSDALFVGLVRSARESGWEGPEAAQLLNSVLPALARPLAADFPELELSEILSWAWEKADNPHLSTKRHPRTWLVKSLRMELISLVRAQRDGTSASKIKAGGWWEEREHLVASTTVSAAGWRKERESDDGAGGYLVITGPAADEYLAAVPSAPPRAATGVWDDLRRLLTRLAWPEAVADRAVEVLEGRAELAKGGVNLEGTVRKLKFLPKGYPTRLTKFAFAKEGFVWARLHGIDVDRAVLLSTTTEDLQGLVWNPSSTLQSREPPSASIRSSIQLRSGIPS